MQWRTWLIVILIVLLCVSLGLTGMLIYTLSTQDNSIPVPEAVLRATPVVPTPVPDDPLAPIPVPVTVYYLTADQRKLAPVTQQALVSPTLNARIEAAVELLLAGPDAVQGRGLIQPLPTGVELQSVLWDDPQGRVYVSFNEALLNTHDAHALREWAMIFSIVNTIADQSAAIESVQILINGQEIESAYTTWDWSRPFEPDEVFVEYSPGANQGETGG